MPRETSKVRQWEKNRRNRLNDAFSFLYKLLPSYDPAVNISKFDILKNASSYIEELHTKIKEFVSQECKEETLKKVKEEYISLQERIKKLLSRNEQLCALLHEAHISIPAGYTPIKKFRNPNFPWSNRISTDQAKIFQKKEQEKENSRSKATKFVNKKPKAQNGTPKHRKAILNRPDPKKVKTRKKKVMPSKCVIVLSQPNTQPCYVITNAPSNVLGSTSTVITNSGLVANPLVSSKPAKTIASIPPLGPGTLILANGTIMPVVPQQTVLPLTPQIISRPPIIVVPKTSATSNSSTTGTVASQNKTIKSLARIKPKFCQTKTTQVNKVPIPALTSRYSNVDIVLKTVQPKTIKKTTTDKRRVKETKGKDDVQINEKRKTTSESGTEVKKAKIDCGIKEKETDESSVSKTVASANKVIEEVSKSGVEEKTVEQEKEQAKKSDERIDLNISHSELSNDIFASLQVPAGCQNPESTSPTAAFLLAFPLVSSLTGVKVAEVIEEDNGDSQRGTPSLLHIDAMDNTKRSETENLTSSLLNLDNLSFFSKDVSGFYSSFEGNTSSVNAKNISKAKEAIHQKNEDTPQTKKEDQQTLQQPQSHSKQDEIVKQPEQQKQTIQHSQQLQEKPSQGPQFCQEFKSLHQTQKLSHQQPHQHIQSHQQQIKSVEQQSTHQALQHKALQPLERQHQQIEGIQQRNQHPPQQFQQNQTLKQPSQPTQQQNQLSQESHLMQQKQQHPHSVTPQSSSIKQQTHCLQHNQSTYQQTQSQPKLMHHPPVKLQSQHSQENQPSNQLIQHQHQSLQHKQPLQQSQSLQQAASQLIQQQQSQVQTIQQQSKQVMQQQGETSQSTQFTQQQNPHSQKSQLIQQQTNQLISQQSLQVQSLKQQSNQLIQPQLQHLQQQNQSSQPTQVIQQPTNQFSQQQSSQLIQQHQPIQQKNQPPQVIQQSSNQFSQPQNQPSQQQQSTQLIQQHQSMQQQSQPSQPPQITSQTSNQLIQQRHQPLQQQNQPSKSTQSMQQSSAQCIQQHQTLQQQNQSSQQQSAQLIQQLHQPSQQQNHTINQSLKQQTQSLQSVHQQVQPLQEKNQLGPYFNNANSITNFSGTNNNYPQKTYPYNYEPAKSTPPYLNPIKTYPEPLYTNSSTYTYNSDTSFNQNYYKGISKSDNRYYSLNYENYADYRKNDTSNTYFSSNYYANNANAQKSKSTTQKPPINWMTTPDYVSPLTKEPEFYPQTTYFNDVSERKNLDLPMVPPPYQRTEVEENQFSWSPTKIPQLFDPPTFVSSTLPTLVGDLSLPFGEQKGQQNQKKDTRRMKNYESGTNQGNFLSVSQLVEHSKEVVPARTTTRRNSGNRSSGKKIQQKSNQRKEKETNFTPNKSQSKGYSGGTKNSYSAEALIGNQIQEQKNTRQGNHNKPISVSSFLHDNIVPYFPPVDLPQENYNQNYQASSFGTFQNNTYPANSFGTTYNFMPEVPPHDYSEINLFPNKDKSKNPNRSRDVQCSTPKKSKRKHSTEMPNFVDFTFLSMPGTINSPILPDDFHTHTGFLQPPTPQLYPCKNPFTKPNDLASSSLLPLPPVPVNKSTIQPDISPSINNAGTSLTNFNLSTIFPEINKSVVADPFTESRKEVPKSYTSTVQVSLNDKLTSLSYINCSTTQSYSQ